MALKGYTKLELARAGKIVKRIEKHNVISPYISGLTKQGNMWYMTPSSKIYPLYDRMFGGCLLTDNLNPDGDEVSGFFGMIGGNSNVVAQCSNDAYNGNNPRRGSYNTNESGVITGGFRHVFDWGTDRGNGTISGIGLCRPQIARADYSNDSTRIPTTDAYLNEHLKADYYSSSISFDDALLYLDALDYDREVGYIINYSNGVITVTECAMNTKILHLDGEFGHARKKTDHTISQTVNNFDSSWQLNCIAYTGDYIHLIVFANNGATLDDYAIKTADWTCTKTSHTFTGAKFTPFSRSNARVLHGGDGMLIKNGYLYALSDSAKKIVKCNLSNDADVTEYDNPICTVGGASNWADDHGCFCLLPNGDFYIFGWNGAGNPYPCVYCHNDNFYYSRCFQNDLFRARFSNAYGTILTISPANNHVNYFLETIFPFVSTVNNLEEAVTKSADLTMKLTYEITETTA